MAAHACAGEPVERRRVGDAGRARQDGLDAGALLRLLPELPGDAVRSIARRGVVRRRAGTVHVVRPAARFGGAAQGAGGEYGLRLLRGSEAVQGQGAPRGMYQGLGLQCVGVCKLLLLIKLFLELF